MKKVHILMAFPVLILALVFLLKPDSLAENSRPKTDTSYSAILTSEKITSPAESAYVPATAPASEKAARTNPIENLGNDATEIPAETTGNDTDLIKYAFSLMGTPYIYAGITPDGFDCSGFTTHVFSEIGVAIPHSSALQANEGIAVSRADAREGDLVIFTGTNPEKRTPGHVGIVISAPGDTISFIHSSSVGGVKVSKVEGTGYDRRFLEIRRVL